MTTEDRSLNLLLVDDDDADVMNVRRAFSKARLTDPLYVAGDGVQAVKLVTFASFVDVMATLNRYWTLVELP